MLVSKEHITPNNTKCKCILYLHISLNLERNIMGKAKDDNEK